ncbi:Glycosyltransferase involved in cell wall bisynthesis [Agreia sp. VKM Ac-1783]|nr:glycosyltransferase family 1 protein [Agreia sp. VKM Ac-1783]SMQ60544.1 Glycosyltransferase involved in cell wall bisynthesis [Agreia sp. VKM Ac-1783]
MSLMSRAVASLTTEGPRQAASRVFNRLSIQLQTNRLGDSLVRPEDAVAVDWTVPPLFATDPPKPKTENVKTAWIISPPGRTSGGHQNAFRFMDFLEKAGHSVTVYFYTTESKPIDLVAIREMLRSTSAYPDLRGQLRIYDLEKGLDLDTDAVFATGWETAYPAYLHPTNARRFYFTQDFEPAFYPSGSDYVLAENTYRFGFHGISAGRWLASKLTAEYGMPGDHYDYAVDKDHYSLINSNRRTEVLFYARPPTARRAFEFGRLVLTELHRLRPDIVINMVGWDISPYPVPFPYVNHTALDISQLNEVYNRCAGALILSLTNMSLLPMEVMASGVVPVVNDAPNTREIFDSPYIDYQPLSPGAMAARLIAIVDDENQVSHATSMAASVASTDWIDPGETFIRDFTAAMAGAADGASAH